MRLYKNIIRPVLFMFQPETAHKIVIMLLKFPLVPKFLRLLYGNQIKKIHFEKHGFKLRNKIGLAAGLDKDGEIIKGLEALGFGFIEIGTITPLGQPGNAKPRLRRLKKDSALLNRMGFNNKGIVEIKKKLLKLKTKTTIGINIGKNKQTSLEDAYKDYVQVFDQLYELGDYFVINVSSPNTPNLRQLQGKEYLEKILLELNKIKTEKAISKPLLVKIAPDLEFEQIDEIIELVKKFNLSGIIAVNTTIKRNNLSEKSVAIAEAFGTGGLSGKPLKNRSTEVIQYIKKQNNNEFLIIGVGGIFNCEDVKEKINAGADLIQIYTSFIYEGPAIVKKLSKCF